MALLELNEVVISPVLSPFVDGLWFCQIEERGRLCLLPNANTELLAFRTHYGNGLAFVGPMSAAHRTDVHPGDICVGARMKMGTRIVAQKYDYATLRDTRIYGRHFDHPAPRQFENDFALLQDPKEIVSKMEHLLLELTSENLLVRDKLVDKFISIAYEHAGQISTEAAMTRIPLSLRQFRRRFMEYTGFTPKEFLVMCRRQSAIKDMKLRTGDTISDIAATNGYTDHAHFTKDFRAAIGITPITFEHELTIK
ncbi:MAG: Transcriptional regulator, AraC family [Candidatus Saccharibacteria bacterium]|nr:Transcriptional regulator, AraC family [Candidatus Saccharibacteria bacterium]